MLHVLALTAPIYIVIALGYCAGRVGLFARSDLRVLGKFVINFALPALLFKALSTRSIGEIFNGSYLAAYLLGSLTMFAAGSAYARVVQKRSRADGAIYGLGMSFSNSGFVGYPIVLQILGPPAAVALALCMVIENLLLLPLFFAAAEGGDGGAKHWNRVLGGTIVRTLVNPIVVAIAAGFAVALAAIELPEPLLRSIDLLANASTALALFVIGGTLVGLEIHGLLAQAGAIAFGKLLLHPLAVCVVLLLLPPIDHKLRVAAVAYAGMPMLSIYPILAQKYGREEFCAAALLLTTVISFVTISAILWALHAVLGWTW